MKRLLACLALAGALVAAPAFADQERAIPGRLDPGHQSDRETGDAGQPMRIGDLLEAGATIVGVTDDVVYIQHDVRLYRCPTQSPRSVCRDVS